jgi:hypothetical protein
MGKNLKTDMGDKKPLAEVLWQRRGINVVKKKE